MDYFGKNIKIYYPWSFLINKFLFSSDYKLIFFWELFIFLFLINYIWHQNEKWLKKQYFLVKKKKINKFFYKFLLLRQKNTIFKAAFL
ncbi:unnamed protein product [Blepharisma stoltei]|uniref:ATP synthase F0 subunit 8 n=1 Tax=Blepharisma stoltei TaxID=1481888 RepID=A0AAU9IWG2_9CILI|nr:unnamed protein product [Blepharisma stoltei]